MIRCGGIEGVKILQVSDGEAKDWLDGLLRLPFGLVASALTSLKREQKYTGVNFRSSTTSLVFKLQLGSKRFYSQLRRSGSLGRSHFSLLRYPLNTGQDNLSRFSQLDT